MAKNELVSLALLTVAPLHAYAISAVVDELGMDHWAQVSRASLYSALSRLEKRGAIAVTTVKVDNMPERKVYSITPEGSEMFHKELHDAIVTVNKSDGMLFHLAVNFFYGATVEEGVVWAKERLEALRFVNNHVQEEHDKMAKISCESALISLRMAVKMVDSEICAVEEFISLLETKPDFYATDFEKFRELLMQKFQS